MSIDIFILIDVLEQSRDEDRSNTFQFAGISLYQDQETNLVHKVIISNPVYQPCEQSIEETTLWIDVTL